MRLWNPKKGREVSPEKEKIVAVPKISPRSEPPVQLSPRKKKTSSPRRNNVKSPRAVDRLARLQRHSVKELIFSSSSSSSSPSSAGGAAGGDEDGEEGDTLRRVPQAAVAFVLRSFLGEWVEQANSQLKNMMEKTTVEAAESDPTLENSFQHLLDSLGRVGRHNLDEVVNVLLAWRENQLIEAPAVAKRIAGTQKGVKSEALEERHLVLTEMLFCQALRAVLAFVTRKTLTDVQSAKVEELCFLNSIPRRGNNEDISRLYAQCLGCLAPYRLPQIRTKFETYVANMKKSNNVQHVAKSLGFLQLEIGSEEAVTDVIGLLAIFQTLVSRTKGKHAEQLRPHLILSLTAMLHPLLAKSKNLPNGVDYATWRGFVKETYQLFSKKLMLPKAREKDAPYFSILSILLCLSSSEFFLENYLTLTEYIAVPKLIKKEKRHEEDNKLGFTYLLEALSPLVERFLSSEFDGYAQAQQEMLELLHARLFEIRDKRLGPLPDESLDSIVAIIVSMAKKKPEFTLQRVIYPLLSSSGSGSDEKIIVGLRVVHHLFVGQVEMADTTMELGNLLGLILSHCDTMYGRALLQEKTIEIPATTLIMFQEAILAVRYVQPTRWTISDLFLKLCSYVVHQQEEIQEAAKQTMRFLMKTAPHHRSEMIHMCADFLVDQEYAKIERQELVLVQIHVLLGAWCREVDGFQKTALKYDRLEGIAVTFLCNGNSQLRGPAMDVLESLRELYTLLRTPKYSAGQPRVRVLTVFEEMEEDVVKLITTDFRFRRMDNPKFHPEKNMALYELMNSPSREYQLSWNFALARIIVTAFALCPKAIQVCRCLCLIRLEQLVLVNEKTHEKDANTLLMSFLNYSTTCVSTWGTDSPALDPWIEDRLDSVKTVPREPHIMLNRLINITTKNAYYSMIGAVSLGHCEPSIVPHLFECLNGAIEDAGKTAGGVFRTRRTYSVLASEPRRWEFIGAIYSRIAGLMPKRHLKVDGILRGHFIATAESMHKYLIQHDSVTEVDQFSIRFFFCTMIRHVAAVLNHDNTNKTKSSMSAGLRGGLFAYLVRWTQGPQMMENKNVKEQMAQHAKNAKTPADHEAFYQRAREQVTVLQHFACDAAASLVATPWPSPITADHPVMSWLVSLLRSTNTKEGKRLRLVALDAVSSFLRGNYLQAGMLEVAYDHCYPRSNDTLDRTTPDVFFFALIELMEARPDCPRQLDRLLHIVLAKTGDKKLQVRRGALKLLQLVTYSSPVRWEEFDSLSVDSELDDTYRYTQLSLSQRLSKGLQFLGQGLFDEMVLRVENLSVDTRKQALEYIVPWLKYIQLYKSPSKILYKTLFNFCLITYKYQQEHPLQIQRMWQTLVEDLGNVDPVITFLLRIGSKRRSPDFIPLAKKIILYVSRAAPEVTVSALVDELSSLSVDTGLKPKLSASADADSEYLSQLMQLHPFQAAMPDVSSMYLPSAGHLALILVAELAFEAGFYFRPHLAVVLQQVFLGFTFPQALVYEHSRMLLLNIIQALVVDRYTQQTTEEVEAGVGVAIDDYEEGLELVEFLKSKAGKPIFQTRTDPGTLMMTIVESVIQTLSPKSESDDANTLSDQWAVEAYSWAIFCPLPQLQSCSFIVYRALSPALSKEALTGMTEVIARLLLSKLPEHIELVFNILTTITAMLKQTDVNQLSVYTQVFWAATAVMHSDMEAAFIEGCNIIEVVLSSLNFSDNLIQNVFVASVPEHNHFPLQLLLHRGLWAAQTEPYTIRLLIKLCALPASCNKLVQSQQRSLGCVIGLLPWLVVHASMGDSNEATDCAEALGRFCSSQGLKDLGAVFLGWSEYSNPSEFLSALTVPFVAAFFPQHEVFVLQFAFSLLERGPVKYNRSMMLLLQFLVPHADTESERISTLMLGWLVILERMINGPLMADALDLLDICLAQSAALAQYSITLDKVNVSGFSTMVSAPEFNNKVAKGNEAASMELLALLRSHGVEVTSPEEIVSSAFFAKFVPSSDDHTFDTVSEREDELFQDDGDMFGGGFSGFTDLMANLDEGPPADPLNSAGPAFASPQFGGESSSFSSLNDQFNAAWREKDVAKAASIAFMLLPALYDAYLDAALLAIDAPSDEGLKLLVSRYEDLIVAQDLAPMFSSSLACAAPKQKQSSAALGAPLATFGEKLRQYVTAKALFDKKARKSGADKLLLRTLADLNLEFLRVSQAGFQMRIAVSEITKTPYEPPSSELFRYGIEENQQFKNELNAE